jgi:calcineurin-like phosphoesterase family protein
MPAVFLVSDTHFGHTGVLRCSTMRNGVKNAKPFD